MYQVEFLPASIDDLSTLDRTVAQRMIRKLRWLAENFDAVKPESLSALLAGLLKLRLGDYRILYEVDHQPTLLIIHLVGHRREIYNRIQAGEVLLE